MAPFNSPLVPYQRPTKPFCGLVLVGEAPGAEEVVQGRPFCGRSGKLLDEVLADAGLDRACLVIANVFRFRPPNNKVDHFFCGPRAATAEGIAVDATWGKFGSGHVRAEFASELTALRDIIAEFQPRAVVTLGRTPLWAVAGYNGPMGAVRGQVQANRLVAGIPVMPTFHPSFIIRGNWAQKAVMTQDITAALQQPAAVAA